jgi:hypothetical protein
MNIKRKLGLFLGSVSAVISLIIFIIFTKINPVKYPDSVIVNALGYLFLFFAFPGYLFVRLSGLLEASHWYSESAIIIPNFLNGLIAIIILCLVNFIIYFLIGMLIGYVYGKIRHRND